jgi:hypothetical protein
VKEDIAVPQSQLDPSTRAGGTGGTGGAGGAGWRTATQQQIADLPMVLESK